MDRILFPDEHVPQDISRTLADVYLFYAEIGKDEKEKEQNLYKFLFPERTPGKEIITSSINLRYALRHYFRCNACWEQYKHIEESLNDDTLRDAENEHKRPKTAEEKARLRLIAKGLHLYSHKKN